ncbi:MAG TPA: hypothetical protein VGH87_17155 [Polyangiaceae bacterium]
MKARVFALALVVACKSAAIATLAAEPAECKSPRFDDGSSCETIEETFWADMAGACSDAQPSLSDALRAVARDETLGPLPSGSEHWRARDRRSFTLFQASWALLPPECTTDFDAKHYAGDDYGRAVSEMSRLGQSDPRCRPDEALFRARGDAQGTIDIGVWSFATVLAPHLTQAGKAYLRELLVCEERKL